MGSAANRPSFNYVSMRWALIPVVAAHNFEEWLTFPLFGNVPQTAAARLGLPFEPPSWTATQIALVLVTVLPAFVVIWASFGRQRLIKDMLVCGIAGIFFANIFIPHLPLSIAIGGYSPGVVTAIVINLPFCLFLWRCAVRESILSARHIVIAGSLGLFALVPSIVIAYAVSNIVLSVL